MSYGQNMPQGLQATKTLGSATYNGATSPYLIESGYSQNIFQGDPVVYDYTKGYITSIISPSDGAVSAHAIIGVFDGCAFQTTTATNPIDPASPGRMYWPANTVTLNSLPAIANIIDDPMVIYNIQTNATPGLAQVNMGSTYNVAYTLSGNIVQGNTNTGQSKVSLNQSTVGLSATANLRAIRLVAVTGNNASLGYNNAEVIIQNHLYCARPVS